MELVLRAMKRCDFDNVPRELKFSMSYREKRKIVMNVPYKENKLYISAEKDFDFANLPFKILKILGN